MSTLERIKLLVRANLNDTLKKAEDPVKTSGLMVEEMRESVRSIKQYLASTVVDLKRMEREADAKEQEARRWEERAGFALGKGEEELARRALLRKRAHQQAAEALRSQTPDQKAAIQSLREDLQTLETQLEAIRQKHIRLTVTQEYKTKRPAPERPVVLPPTELILDASTLDAYEHMVQKVEDMEAMSEAIAEINQGDELERQLDQLETQTDVERELTALKAKLKEETP